MFNFLLIIQREFITKVRSKSYLILLFLSPLLMVIMFGVLFYFINKDQQSANKIEDKNRILVVGKDHLTLELKNFIVDKFNDLSEEQVVALMQQKTYDAGVFTDFKTKKIQIYTSVTTPKYQIINQIKAQWRAYVLKSHAIDPLVIQETMTMPSVATINVANSTNQVEKWVKRTVAIGAGYLLMMFLIIYGNSVMRSIIEEKNSRVIEIMICTVKPFQLMMGKIIGNALAGILQFSIWALLLIGGITALQTLSPETSAEAQMIPQILEAVQAIDLSKIILGFLGFFILGFLLFSSFYAAIGAAVNSETDTQQFVHPILLPLMFAVYIGMATVINGNPHGETATLFSMIPLTSPVVMLMRIPFGVPVWQLLIALALLLVSFIIMVFVASKIYRIGILTYGSKPSFKQITKWLKY